MSKFFKALEQAEQERILREEIRREGANPTALARAAPASPRDHPGPARTALATKPPSAPPLVCRIQEVKVRDGMLVAVATVGDGRNGAKADLVIPIPPALHWIQPLLVALPLQLLAYHLSILQGCSGDQPRNPSQSIVVE